MLRSANELREGRGKIWALLVGINAYQCPNVRKLQNCVRDVSLFEEVLTQKFAERMVNIERVLESTARKVYILERLAFYAKELKENDVFLFYFAGHGCRFDDQDKRKHNGHIECLVPIEGDWNRIETVITDCELEDIVASFRTRSVGLICDSCNSGGIGRGEDKEDPSARGLFPSNAVLTREPSGRLCIDVESCVVLSGCRDKESVFDLSDARHGPLTFLLCRVLRAMSAERLAAQTWQSVYDEILEEQRRLHVSQRQIIPQLEGRVEMLFLGNRLLTSLRFVRVVRDENTSEFALCAGSVHGIGKGSKWAVYLAPLQGSGEDEATLVDVEMKALGNTRSTLALDAFSSARLVGRALCTSVYFENTVRVRLEPGVERVRNLAEQLQRALASSSFMGAYPEGMEETADLSVRATQGCVLLVQGNEELFHMCLSDDGEKAEHCTTFVQNVEKAAWRCGVEKYLNAIMGRQRANGPEAPWVELRLVTPGGGDRVPLVEGSPVTLMDDQRFLIDHRTTREKVYLTIFYIDSAESLTIIYPPRGGHTAQPPQADGAWRPLKNRANYMFVCARSHLRENGDSSDTMYVVCTRKPTDFGFLSTEPFIVPNDDAHRGPGEERDQLVPKALVKESKYHRVYKFSLRIKPKSRQEAFANGLHHHPSWRVYDPVALKALSASLLAEPVNPLGPGVLNVFDVPDEFRVKVGAVNDPGATSIAIFIHGLHDNAKNTWKHVATEDYGGDSGLIRKQFADGAKVRALIVDALGFFDAYSFATVVEKVRAEVLAASDEVKEIMFVTHDVSAFVAMQLWLAEASLRERTTKIVVIGGVDVDDVLRSNASAVSSIFGWKTMVLESDSGEQLRRRFGDAVASMRECKNAFVGAGGNEKIVLNLHL